MAPLMEPTQDFFGLTDGIIFFFPKSVPKIKAEESQAHTDNVRAKVKFVFIKRSNCRKSIAVPNRTGTNNIPAKVDAMFKVAFLLF